MVVYTPPSWLSYTLIPLEKPGAATATVEMRDESVKTAIDSKKGDFVVVPILELMLRNYCSVNITQCNPLNIS